MSENCQPFHSWEWFTEKVSPLLANHKGKIRSCQMGSWTWIHCWDCCFSTGHWQPSDLLPYGISNEINEIWALNESVGWFRSWIFNGKNYKTLPCQQVWVLLLTFHNHLPNSSAMHKKLTGIFALVDPLYPWDTNVSHFYKWLYTWSHSVYPLCPGVSKEKRSVHLFFSQMWWCVLSSSPWCTVGKLKLTDFGILISCWQSLGFFKIIP